MPGVWAAFRRSCFWVYHSFQVQFLSPRCFWFFSSLECIRGILIYILRGCLRDNYLWFLPGVPICHPKLDFDPPESGRNSGPNPPLGTMKTLGSRGFGWQHRFVKCRMIWTFFFQVSVDGKKHPPDSKCGAGQCEYDQLRCITKIVGLPPKEQPRPPFFAFFASGEESVISCRSVVVSNTFFVNFCLPTLGRWTEFDKDIHFKWVWNVETTN